MKIKYVEEKLQLENFNKKEVEDLQSKLLLETDQKASQTQQAQAQITDLSSQLSQKSEKLNCKTKALEHEIQSHNSAKSEI